MKIRNDQILEMVLMEARVGLHDVMENINDVKTDREKPRKISMVIELKPNTNVDLMDIKVKTELTLAPREIKYNVTQYDENQMSFYDEAEEEDDGRS